MVIFTQGDNYLEFHNQNETVRITAWGDNSFRITATPAGPLDLSNDALLSTNSSANINVQEPGEATIQNGNIKAVVTSNRFNTRWGIISFYNQDGKLLLRETDRGGALNKRPRSYHTISGDDFKVTATFLGNSNEQIFGMGQYQDGTFNLKGSVLELAHRNSQASVPFYVSNLGYGFLWANPAIGKVFFGSNHSEWTADSSRQLDYWITAGDTPAQIEQQYSSVTGHVPMMPEYGLGYWQCKLRYYNQQQVLDVAREYHRRKIPVDVIVIDYYHWPRCGDYRFDPDYFPDPDAMVKELNDYGIKLMVSVWPQIDVRSENYEEMRDKGLLVRTDRGIDVQMLFHGNNVFYDATNPEARKFVWNKIKQNYEKHGIELFWLDEAEPEYGQYDFDNYHYYAGAAVQKSNLYPREYVRGFYDGQKQEDKVTVKLARCAWIGSQRYGTLVWSGDISSTFETLRRQLIAGLQMGIAGIPWWTTDIGGFSGGDITKPAFQELLIRWFQFATFCPVMRMHGARNPFQKLFKKNGEETEGTGAANEIWSYGEKNYKIMKKFIGIRELLRSYSRNTMKEAHVSGSPVMRPLFYGFPKDRNTWPVDDAYMYGDDILVAPIMQAGATQRTVYLPEGASWTNAHTGKEYQGGQRIMVNAPIETLPIFLKDGHCAELIKKI
ncbi:family 31 glucosidase [Sporolactobacillus shoreicorticis]|uniref:TIM-barrel domain-containing protein n=1 Tax=Sporolactobacillus shoreicorticis TaxID=1923877 RepID=A0ABW5SAK4_9BACL|nr:TIM-barrel domain-containing protein [Sporolactobacillus shoreicorticis]MCO7127902.1 family 31 glucosidase [Sporolactobacillus shoreicorticis]